MTIEFARFFAAASIFTLSAIACAPEQPAMATSGQTGSSLLPGSGGGDASLQKKLADPAPIGAVPLNIEVMAEGLANPWSMAWLPNGDMLFTERDGKLRILRDGTLVATPVANTPPSYVAGQGGYFDILLHPDFASNSTVYLSFAAGTSKQNGTRVIRAVFDGAALSDIETIYDAAPLKDTTHHFGGRMAWGQDGKLYLTVGEGSKYKEKAQDMTSSFGAVVRLNEDGTIPDDNPNFGPQSRAELFTKGHRNPQGLAYDAARGILWEHEHGARGGDEINIIEAGGNYGWPAATYGIDYNGARITPFTEYGGTTQPVKYWTPSIGPSGLAIYEGDLFPEWRGDLLVGALAGPHGMALHRIIMDGVEPVGEERYLTELKERIRDVRVGPDGAIYVATEDRAGAPVGRILRVTPQ